MPRQYSYGSKLRIGRIDVIHVHDMRGVVDGCRVGSSLSAACQKAARSENNRTSFHHLSPMIQAGNSANSIERFSRLTSSALPDDLGSTSRVRVSARLQLSPAPEMGERQHQSRLAKVRLGDETSPCWIVRRSRRCMKTNMLACSAAIVATGCTSADAHAAAILSQLVGNEGDAVIGNIQARNPGSLCSIVTTDGAPRLMSFGQQAVVNVNGRPVVLPYHPSGGNEASFTGAGIRI